MSKCAMCNQRNVCGGLNKGYFAAHTDAELKPYIDTAISDDVNLYRREQETVDIIVPAYNLTTNLGRLLIEIINKTKPPYNLILIRQKNSAAINRNIGLSKSNSKFIIMCDDDIAELPYEWNKKLTDVLLYNPDIAVVSARLLTEDGKIGVNSANNFDITKPLIEVNMVPTACVCFRASDFKRFNIKFNEQHCGSGWEDTNFFSELIHKLKKEKLGIKIVINNDCKVAHLNTETNNNQWYEYNKQLFLKDEERRKNEM